MDQMVLFGRILYSAVFLVSVPAHFTEGTIQYGASQGVPMAGFFVPLAGIVALLGGLSILIGYKAKEGAWLIVLFLAPVTLMVHHFWNIADPAAAAVHQVHFVKNLSLLGAALLISYFGSGPMSLEGWAKRRSRERHGTKMIDLTSRRR
ncbi:MAG: DoxX family protein [Nitrospirae bacterium GWD2_57_9]|nr:MAG: DoxX family protein [Nitrospirae bacterium GWD2_57_9]OGW48225.1 MAG: DoxX family protein [Nitrospirae bacterium GWC2_57_9]